MKESSLSLLAALSTVLCGCEPVAVTEGENGAWSPDGERIAFQRHNGRDYDVGVLKLKGGAINWVAAGDGEAAYPVWAPDGSLVYTYYAGRQTAYAALKSKSKEGFNLYRYGTDGKSVRLTHDWVFDFTPSVAPDGSLWFASTRGCDYTNVSRLFRAPSLAAADKVEAVYEVKGGDNRGVYSPTVSPDGKFVVWAELQSFWGAWTLMIAKADAPSDALEFLPKGTIGYSPAWHPDGRHIFFTGFRPGDDGWYVYIVEVETGALVRREKGRNPAVAPDGRQYLYDDGHTIFRQQLSADDLPRGVAADAENRFVKVPEKVLMRLDAPKKDDRGKMPAEAALPQDSVWFARAVVDWDGDASKYQRVFWGGWEPSNLGCQLYFAMGTPHFAARTFDNSLYSVSSGKIYPHDQPINITGICTPEAIYVSVNDGPPVARLLSTGLIDTQKPTVWSVGNNANATTHFKFIEFGTGWPKNVPAPHTVKELFQ